MMKPTQKGFSKIPRFRIFVRMRLSCFHRMGLTVPKRMPLGPSGLGYIAFWPALCPFGPVAFCLAAWHSWRF